MPLNARQIAVSTAVICFFALGFIGWFSNLTPFTCCKRAIAGAILAYLAAACAIKAVNAILTNAMITKYLNKQKEKTGAGTN
jgi:hypothetical protein